MPPQWSYLTVYISGMLDFPETVSRVDALAWAGKAITQQLNEYAAQGWEVIEMVWISEKEAMVTFKRPADENADHSAPA
jgi:hypothetical protein